MFLSVSQISFHHYYLSFVPVWSLLWTSFSIFSEIITLSLFSVSGNIQSVCVGEVWFVYKLFYNAICKSSLHPPLNKVIRFKILTFCGGLWDEGPPDDNGLALRWSSCRCQRGSPTGQGSGLPPTAAICQEQPLTIVGAPLIGPWQKKWLLLPMQLPVGGNMGCQP